tara:strand:- start:314 stop:481 length:168 start_codon:yes stop_codon:yes gene_type:complete
MYKKNNVFIDTMMCVRDLLRLGVIYPLVTDEMEMPPEQEKIMMQQMQKQIQWMQQ